HFSFYVNVCVGLGLGLLVGLRNRSRPAGEGHGLLPLPALLREPPVLWVSSALALMVSAVALSLSRGGLLALCGATLVCLLLGLCRSRRFAALGSVALVAALAFLILIASGLTRVQDRVATVWEGTAFLENRIPMWGRVLPAAADFPLLGTGYG